MKFLVIVLVASTVLAAPQLDVKDDDDDDVELVSGPRRPPSDGKEPDRVLFFFPGFSNVQDFFSNFFGRPRFPGLTSDEDILETFPENPVSRSRGGFFPSLFDSFFDFPRPSENSTVTFQNSSIEVQNIGGVPMMVNRTIEERTGDNGSVYFKVEQRVVGPYNATNSTSESTTGSSFSTSTTGSSFSTSTTPSTTTTTTTTTTKVSPA